MAINAITRVQPNPSLVATRAAMGGVSGQVASGNVQSILGGKRIPATGTEQNERSRVTESAGTSSAEDYQGYLDAVALTISHCVVPVDCLKLIKDTEEQRSQILNSIPEQPEQEVVLPTILFESDSNLSVNVICE